MRPSHLIFILVYICPGRLSEPFSEISLINKINLSKIKLNFRKNEVDGIDMKGGDI